MILARKLTTKSIADNSDLVVKPISETLLEICKDCFGAACARKLRYILTVIGGDKPTFAALFSLWGLNYTKHRPYK